MEPISEQTCSKFDFLEEFGFIVQFFCSGEFGVRNVKFEGVHTHHWKCQLAKIKELLIPPIWDCCGPTEGSFFTHGQIKKSSLF